MVIRIGVVVAALIAVALLGVACADKIAGEAVEKVIESGADGAKVDIDSDSGSVKVSGDDGSSSFEFGDDVTLPDDFPDLPLPDDAKATGVVHVETEGPPSTTATFTTGMSISDLYDRFVGGLEDRGYVIDQKMRFDGEQGEGFSIIASSGEAQVAVFAGADAGEDGNGFTVGITLHE